MGGWSLGTEAVIRSGDVVVVTSSGVVDSGVVVVVSSAGAGTFSPSSSTGLSHSSLVTENDEDTIVYGVAENSLTEAGVVVGLEGAMVGVVCGAVGPSVAVVVIVVVNGVVIGSVTDSLAVDTTVDVGTVVVVDVVVVVVVVVGTRGIGIWTGLICDTWARPPETLERFSNPSLFPKVRQHCTWP